MSTSQNRKTGKYRLKFIGALIKSDCNSEETALLSQTAAEHGISLIDLCAMYNILQYAHQRSKNRYPARKIIEVIGLMAANAAKEKSAYDTHRAKQRWCPNGHGYIFPDVIYPDAGAIFDAGIVGKHRIEPITVCPECRVRV